MKEKEKKETKVNKEEKEKVSLFKKIFKKDSKKDIINSAKKTRKVITCEKKKLSLKMTSKKIFNLMNMPMFL